MGMLASAAYRVQPFGPRPYQGCLTMQAMPFSWHQLVQTAHSFSLFAHFRCRLVLCPDEPLYSAGLFFCPLYEHFVLQLHRGKWLECSHLSLLSPLAHI